MGEEEPGRRRATGYGRRDEMTDAVVAIMMCWRVRSEGRSRMGGSRGCSSSWGLSTNEQSERAWRAGGYAEVDPGTDADDKFRFEMDPRWSDTGDR
jgi:hypothetical protein